LSHAADRVEINQARDAICVNAVHQMKIAQSFSSGFVRAKNQVPPGRKKTSAVPAGLFPLPDA
jgi:hypothetical protein